MISLKTENKVNARAKERCSLSRSLCALSWWQVVKTRMEGVEEC